MTDKASPLARLCSKKKAMYKRGLVISGGLEFALAIFCCRMMGFIMFEFPGIVSL